jgi:hypothetical protein
MATIGCRGLLTLWAGTAILGQVLAVGGTEAPLPAFGRDTVLVWKTENQKETSAFVVRIAAFAPGRYIEWEDSVAQGTIFMTESAVTSGKGFLNARLFEAGVDTRGKDATTLWLSRRIFQGLKEKKKIKLLVDSLEDEMTLEGIDQISVEVNRVPTQLRVIKVADRRGSVRWFLDDENNPLMVQHSVRNYTQTLSSITTDRPNTLRWIKGKKLENPH